jgi:hypothetical protein
MTNHKIIAILFLTINTICSYAQVNFAFRSQYQYLKGNEASGISSGWMNSSFDDSSWQTGIAPFRYGDGSGGTELTDMRYNYSVVYLRASFTASNVQNISTLNLEVDYDDGFVLWINGEEAVRRNAPQVLTNTSLSEGLHESGVPESIELDLSDFTLFEGENTMAVQALNVSVGESSDFYFDCSINAQPSLPQIIDTVGLGFSHKAGFYDESFTLTITSAVPGTNLQYTLDGSNPINSPTALSSGFPASILIDPNNTDNRPATPAFIVRASLAKPGFTSSFPESRTFIFIEKVKEQSHPGDSWPVTNINGQLIDLHMDPRVTNDARYINDIEDALLDIPSISVQTDNANLFDAYTGIYVNAWGHGPEWERECSVELINPDGSEGFDVNAGIRIRGGWSRHNDFPKHAFRLFFRNEYGDAKLNFPLFGEEGVNEFDKVDLRTAQNYAWANGYSYRNTFVREIFSRDLQREMNQPYTRSRYYHLYLNGMYWGLFQTQERSEARYAASYLGDNKEDYDVVKVSTENWEYFVEATDGNLNAWEEVYNRCETGFTNNEHYFALEGKNEEGNQVVDSEVLVDIDNLIDYMITIFYTGNFDAPTSSFGGNGGPNNFYAIFNRNDKTKGFIFFNHDAEHTLMVEPVSPGVGLYEDRVNLDMDLWGFGAFHPQWLHEKLSENEEYRQRFADRAAKYFSNGGVCTQGPAVELFQKRADQISDAIIAESARWGDSKKSEPATKHDHWLPEINSVLTSFFPYRTEIVIDQLIEAGLYTAVKAPVFSINDTEYSKERYDLNAASIELKIENSHTSGTIYYTVNGEDPRKVGGDISASALVEEDDIILNIDASAVIKARVRFNGNWGPIKQLLISSNNDDFSKLKVTELHYHPLDNIEGSDTISGKSYEFIEFKNTGNTALNLSGLTLDSAVYFQFPDGEILAPGQFYVIATKPKFFYDKYGLIASGNCEKFFSNSGEHVLLTDGNGEEILSFTYDDKNPWPVSADGEGYSLISKELNPTGDPNDFNYWFRSSKIDGSPFADDHENKANTPIVTPELTGVEVYPNPTTRFLNIELSENRGKGMISFDLYSLNGNLIASWKTENYSQIDLGEFDIQHGVYFMKIQSTSKLILKKIIYTP